MLRYRARENRGNGIANLLDATGRVPGEDKRVGERLQSGALPQCKQSVFGRMDKLPRRRARDGQTGFIRKETLQAGGSATAPFNGCAIHYATKGAPTKRLVLQMLR